MEKDPARPKVGKRRLQKFEADTGLTLPDDYRAFLLKYNGGAPVDCRFEIADLREDAQVDYLYGLDRPNWGNLEKQLSRWRDEMPDGFLVIGHDPGGAFLIMGTAGEYAGKVYFWDHQHRSLQSSREQNTYPLADSFTAFMESLVPVDAPSRWDADVSEANELIQTTLSHSKGLQPIQMARLATEFGKLPNPEAVVPLVLDQLFVHKSADVRRVGIGACGRMKTFGVPGLQEALVKKLSDKDAWVRFDAVRVIREAGYDGSAVRKALSKLAKDVLPKDEERADRETSNAELRARVDAKKLLDALLAKS